MSIAEARAAFDAAEDFCMPDPVPLTAPAEMPRPYPVAALQPVMRDAVLTYQAYGQQPLPLVASSALSVASLATQGLADVARDRNLVGPISINTLTIANSGERKTSCDRRMARAAREWEAERRLAMAPEIAAAQAKAAARQAEKDGLLAKIRTSAGKGSVSDAADVDAMQQRLVALEKAAAPVPVKPSLFNEDVTAERLAEEIALGWPSTSVWSDEGGLVIGSHAFSDESAMRYLGLANRLWDGLPFERKRATTKSFVVRGRRRVTYSLMMQEVVFRRLLAAGGGIARSIGFLARFLLAAPASTMGTRLYREADLEAATLAAFDARVRTLLDLPLPIEGDAMVLTPLVLPLSAAARRIWIDYHDDVELELSREGEYGDVADIAAKSAENAARIAAILHVFEHGPGGEISVDLMEAGAQVAAWHLYEARRIVSTREVPAAVKDAQLLLDWLLRKDSNAIEPREILHRGPNRLRDKARRDAAIEVLRETYHLDEVTAGRVTRLHLNPKLRRLS